MKYRPIEIEQMLESMTLIVDTREQPSRKLQKRIEGTKLPHIRKKLEFGDYSCMFTHINGEMCSLESRIAIERKMDLNELCNNFGNERKRFVREFERAKESQALIYLLVENESWEKAYSGRYGESPKYRSRLSSEALVASINAFEMRYGMRVRFCKPETTGKIIRDILYYYLREKLQEGLL